MHEDVSLEMMATSVSSDRAEDVVVLRCKKCLKELVPGSYLSFYEMDAASVHLMIRPECQEDFLETQNSVDLHPQSDIKRIRISSHELRCKACSEIVGSLNATGPKKETIVTLGSQATVLFLKGLPKPGKWGMVANFFAQIERRNGITFYGTQGNNFTNPDTLRKFLSNRRPTISDIIRVSLRELTLDKPRPYQIECFVAAALKNMIIYLPTGAGKTLIAAMLISLYHKLNPLKTILFVVDRVPLAFQQSTYIIEQTNLNVLVACGETTDEIPRHKLRDYPVIVATSGVLLNWIGTLTFMLEDCSLLIFDEIHHSVKSHNYSVLIKRHYTEMNSLSRPHLLGLTASPVSGGVVDMNVGLGELCDGADASVYTPCIYWGELMEAINRPKVTYHIVEQTLENGRMSSAIELYCRSVLNLIKSKLGLSPSVGVLGVIEFNAVRGTLRSLIEHAHNVKNEDALNLLLHLQQVLTAQDLNNVLGPRFAKNYLHELFEKDNLVDNSLVITQFLSSFCNFNSLSGKLTYLIEMLQKIEASVDTRAIVFVETKKTARNLQKILAEIDDIDKKWNPAFFVGQSSGQLDGMSWTEEQSPALQKFRLGQHKLLISTSVLQEGIDVPVCNYVILFDRAWSLTSLIQSRGRARAKDSSYILICTDSQKADYEYLLKTEEDMQKIIVANIASHKSLTPKNCLTSVALVYQAERYTNWPTRSENVGGTGADTKRPIKSLSLTFHNLANEFNANHESFSTLSQMPLKILTSSIEEDIVFYGRKCMVVRAEPLGVSVVRMAEIVKMLSQISRGSEDLHSPVSFKVGGAGNQRGYQQLTLTGENMDFGTFNSPCEFTRVKSFTRPFRLGINMPSELVHLFFMGDGKRVFRMEFNFRILDSYIMVELGSNEQPTSLYLSLKAAANFYFATTETEFVEVKLSTMDSFAWQRATIEDIRPLFDISDISVIKLDLFLSNNVRDLLVPTLRRFESHGMFVLYSKLKQLSCAANLLTSDDLLNLGSACSNFSIFYNLNVLASMASRSLFWRAPKGIVNDLFEFESELQQKFFMELAITLNSNKFANVSKIISDVKREIYEKQKMAMPQLHEDAPSADNTDDNTSVVKFVTLTPTRIVYQFPKRMVQNRILRAFNSEYFLRIHFRDDDMTKISSVKNGGAGIARPLERIRNFLINGLQIGDRKYEFLAMSASQIRDHGCWFVAEHTLNTNDGLIKVNAEYIRSWCGNFSSIKNVAKYVARLGQSLSASHNTTDVLGHNFEIIPDFEVVSTMGDKKKKYTYSDGVGMITYSLAQEIAEKMKFPNIPSAFQIRFAGFKGVLSIRPDSDEFINVKKIWFRPSMRKFESFHHTLEVLNWSEYIPCYLNRQVITIASSLGVPDGSFMNLQDTMLKEMPEMLLNSKNALPVIVQNYKILPPLAFGQLITQGIDSEPFFRSLLLAVYKRQLVELLTRSRVFVPLGRILIGVIDETGTLQENEIFVQITQQGPDLEGIEKGLLIPGNEGCLIVESEVAIAKNPCLHPGDLRRIRAVKNPLLQRYHYDCVVFPRNGPRPITDMCSGSDLDGDLYFVTWDPTLLPPDTHEPMDYSAQAALEKEEITEMDIKNFMVDFISNDQLGPLANAHVAQADILPDGVKSDLCIVLAMKFSQAVDFPKTGIIPKFPKEAKVNSWPDFMQKEGMTTHISEKVIGRMFRRAKSIHYPNISFTVSAPKMDRSLLIPGYELFVGSARKCYEDYVDMVSSNLRLYAISSEAQVFSGSLVELGIMGNDDTRDVMNIVTKKLAEICNFFRKNFLEHTAPEDLAKKASAWYFVTYSEPITPREFSGPILSFPWIVGDHIMLMKEKSAPTPNVPYYSAATCLGKESVGIVKDQLQSEIMSIVVDRFHFFSLLKGLILTAIPDAEVELSGSTIYLMATNTTDVNIYVNIHGDSFKEKLFNAVSGVFDVAIKNNIIEYRGQPFTFTIFNNFHYHESALILRKSLLNSGELFVSVYILLKWARGQHLVRMSQKLSGKICATTLATIFVRLLLNSNLNIKVCKEDVLTFDLEDEVKQIISSIDYLNNLKIERVHQIGFNILSILKFFAFSNDEAVLKVFASHGLKALSGELLSYLCEFSFLAYQLMAQTLRVGNLWEISHTNSVEREVSISRRRPRLWRKFGVSSSVFMEGSSLLLFEGSQSSEDYVNFSLYMMARRPHHLTAQCYLPQLREPQMTDYMELNNDNFLYKEYFSQSFKQLNLSKNIGSTEFGTLKIAVKYGCLYVTNLPKLFLEDISECKIRKVQQALGLGYKSLGDTPSQNYYKSKTSGFKLDHAVFNPLEKSNALKIDQERMEKLLKEEMDEQKFLIPVSKRKATLSAMSSSFEPFIANEDKMRKFLCDSEFFIDQILEGYAVSVTLYNSSTDGNCDFQVMYDTSLGFTKMKYRPLRWLLTDIRGIDCDGKDLRFALTSSKVVEMDDCIPNDPVDDIRQSIKDGVIEFVPGNPSDGSSKLRVTPKFRSNERILVRQSTTQRFRLSGSLAINNFMRKIKNYHPLVPSLLERMYVLLVQVTEHTGHDQSTGLFAEISDKMEFELNFGIEWDELTRDNRFALESLPVIWELAHLFRRYIS